jgi:hypothetical protein
MPSSRRGSFYFEQLLRLMPELSEGSVHRGEAPDYLIELGTRTIGVELTEFHLPPPGGERSHVHTMDLRWKTMLRAFEQHRSLGGPALYLTAAFPGEHPAAKRAIVPSAERLEQAVLAQPVPRHIGEGQFIVPWDALPSEVASLSCWGSVDGIDALWQPMDGGWVAEIQPGDIQATIDSKAAKLSGYRANCTEIWLVIAHDVFFSAPADLSETGLTASYDAAFDRVLWLDARAPAVRDLDARAA